MKKLLTMLLLAGTLSSSATACIACNSQKEIFVRKLNNVITNLNLGIIGKGDNQLPTEKELKSAIKKTNPEVNTDFLAFCNISDNYAHVTSKNQSIYQGEVTVKYSLNHAQELTHLITKRDIGELIKNNSNGNSQEDLSKRIIDTIAQQHASIQKQHLKAEIIPNKTENKAIITSDDSTIYQGQVTVNYSIALDELITETDLGRIKKEANDLPNLETIKNAVCLKNSKTKINEKDIAIESINTSSAIITSCNNKLYSGSVEVKFKSNYSLSSIIKQPYLGELGGGNKKLPTEEEIKEAIKKYNSLIDSDKIEISNIEKTKAKVSAQDKEFYAGEIYVNFKSKTAINLNELITKTDLGILGDGGMLTPSDREIKEAIKKLNLKIDCEKIALLIKDNCSAKVLSGDNKVYFGEVEVTFKTKKDYSDQQIQDKLKEAINNNPITIKSIANNNNQTVIKDIVKQLKNGNDIKNSLPKVYQENFDKNKLGIWDNDLYTQANSNSKIPKEFFKNTDKLTVYVYIGYNSSAQTKNGGIYVPLFVNLESEEIADKAIQESISQESIKKPLEISIGIPQGLHDGIYYIVEQLKVNKKEFFKELITKQYQDFFDENKLGIEETNIYSDNKPTSIITDDKKFANSSKHNLYINFYYNKNGQVGTESSNYLKISVNVLNFNDNEIQKQIKSSADKNPIELYITIQDSLSKGVIEINKQLIAKSFQLVNNLLPLKYQSSFQYKKLDIYTKNIYESDDRKNPEKVPTRITKNTEFSEKGKKTVYFYLIYKNSPDATKNGGIYIPINVTINK